MEGNRQIKETTNFFNSLPGAKVWLLQGSSFCWQLLRAAFASSLILSWGP